jgi:hypothetical protein
MNGNCHEVQTVRGSSRVAKAVDQDKQKREEFLNELEKIRSGPKAPPSQSTSQI